MDKKDIKISFSPQIPVKLLIKDVSKIYVDKVVRAIKGDKGDKGEQGIQGIQGIKGETGAQGIQGEKGDKGDAGIGLSSGGITGQFLSKKSNEDFDTDWEDITIPEQLQADMAQEDETKVDYIRNKKGQYINTTLYEDEEPIFEADIDTVISIVYSLIFDMENGLLWKLGNKQDILEESLVTILPEQWNNKEVIIYTSDVTPESKLWYSPTNESYNDFVDAEIRMIGQDYGQVKFRCETIPEEYINIIIRRA